MQIQLENVGRNVKIFQNWLNLLILEIIFSIKILNNWSEIYTAYFMIFYLDVRIFSAFYK